MVVVATDFLGDSPIGEERRKPLLVLRTLYFVSGGSNHNNLVVGDTYKYPKYKSGQWILSTRKLFSVDLDCVG